MSSDEIDAAILEKTRKELGAIIKAPKLSDKLLKKPPFRFLHDIVTNVIKANGFATKLYTADEMDSAKVQEKDAKVHFLQKIISSVNYTLKLQPPLAAKPIKIVSGLEPEATNEFLQKLAGAAKVPIEKSDKAIGKVLARFADKAEQALKERRESVASESSKPPADAPPQTTPAPEKGTVDDRPTSSAPSKEQIQGEPTDQAPPATEPAAAPAAAPEQPPPKAHPAQPTPIERREEKSRNKEVEKEVVKGPQGIMTEGDKDDKKEKGTLDTDSEEEQDPSAAQALLPGEDGVVVGGDGDGYLARLAAAKKADEEEKQRIAKEAAEKLGEGDDSSGIRLQTTRNKGGKEREVFSTEVSKLKDSLQSLVKITNPLGKTFEYLQEDLDSMSREKMMWQRQAQDTKVKAQEAEHATEESLQPLYSQLQDLEDAISDQVCEAKQNVVIVVQTVAATRILQRHHKNPFFLNRERSDHVLS